MVVKAEKKAAQEYRKREKEGTLPQMIDPELKSEDFKGMNIVRCDLSLITNCFEEMSMNNKNNNSWKDIIGEFSANSNVGLYLKGLEL